MAVKAIQIYINIGGKLKREEEYIVLLNAIEKIRRRVHNKIHRKDGAYDKTAEDIRRIIRDMEHEIESNRKYWK